MTSANAPTESPIARLARSLFGFALLACLLSAAAWIALLRSTPSPNAGLEQARVAILVGFSVLQAGAVALCVGAFRASQPRLHIVAALLSRLLTPWPLALALLIGLLTINLALGPALRDVAPAIIGPFRFLLAGWSFVLALVAATLHWERLRAFGRASAPTWAAVGVLVTGGAGLALLAFVTTTLIERSGVNDQLRGGFDYRELTFIDDGSAPTSATFWQEQSRTRVRWQPYVYWVVDEIHGKFINVGKDGLRQTYTPPNLTDDAPLIAFFGGSTAWGEGARDRYTIPSQLAALLHANGTPARVVSYAQTGYVSTQDLITFQMLLVNGQKPDIAVFYGGFNDVLSAYDQGIVGLTLQEGQRIADSETGRLLRSGQPVLRPLSADLGMRDLSVVAPDAATADAIIRRYLANARLAAQIGAAYGVRVLFVWQPGLAFKENLVGVEATAYADMLARRPRFDAFYRDAHAAFTVQLASAGDLPPFLTLHDLFNGDERAIFYDIIHVNELGNRTIAERIAQAIAPQFPQVLQANVPD
ncbi:SGNH/GDSL hydrolase family protein [Aggregatilineales bacterium SYSU G02658]